MDWIKALIPPLLIASLYRVPIDFITSIVWLAAILFLVFLLISLIKASIQRFYLRSIKQIKASKLVGTALCFLAYFFAEQAIFLSKVSANEKALELAVSMQKYVSEHGSCELADSKWAQHDNYPDYHGTIEYGDYGTKYFVSYGCKPRDKRFYFNVRLNKDSDFRVLHTEEGQLAVEYGHFSNVKKVHVTKETDLKQLARMEIEDGQST
jgi:hypothetical protein